MIILIIKRVQIWWLWGLNRHGGDEQKLFPKWLPIIFACMRLCVRGSYLITSLVVVVVVVGSNLNANFVNVSGKWRFDGKRSLVALSEHRVLERKDQGGNNPPSYLLGTEGFTNGLWGVTPRRACWDGSETRDAKCHTYYMMRMTFPCDGDCDMLSYFSGTSKTLPACSDSRDSGKGLLF